MNTRNLYVVGCYVSFHLHAFKATHLVTVTIPDDVTSTDDIAKLAKDALKKQHIYNDVAAWFTDKESMINWLHGQHSLAVTKYGRSGFSCHKQIIAEYKAAIISLGGMVPGDNTAHPEPKTSQPQNTTEPSGRESISGLIEYGITLIAAIALVGVIFWKCR